MLFLIYHINLKRIRIWVINGNLKRIRIFSTHELPKKKKLIT
jgi:hypothetical protein